METDADSMYLALAEKEMYDCKRNEKKQEWVLLRSKRCNDLFTADVFSKVFPRTFCANYKKTC